MQKKNGQYYYSASDLAVSVSCQHLVQLNKLVADGKIKRPVRKNLLAETLQKRGQEFETAYLEELRAAGKWVVEIDKDDLLTARENTIKAMQEGAEVIYQARMELDCWQGWADFLVRVDTPSDLGSWSYEVQDTKLTSATKAAAVIQIALYSEILIDMQGVAPAAMHIRHPKGFEKFRLIDYMSHYRVVKKRFLAMVSQPTNTYPDPVDHCDVCPWSTDCDKKRREDDHLSLVAGMSKSHITELQERGISTLAQLAKHPLPLPFKPKKGSIKTFNKLREQARLQQEARETGEPTFEILPIEEKRGFHLLPEPSPDDIFLDLEGDPFVMPAGREYLFGYWYDGQYTAHWAESEEAEKEAFETFIDFALAKYQANPAMHIYHYGAYETSALNRLMLRYATRIEETQILLKSKTFINLFLILRQSVRAGVEKYSLKHLERHHQYVRDADLNTVGQAKGYYEMLLQTGQVENANDTIKEMIQLYNQDDCKSTVALFQWLCQLRTQLRNEGNVLPAAVKPNGEESENQTLHQKRVQPLLEALTTGLPADRSTFTPLEQARYFAAHLLDWYGREKRKAQGEKFAFNETEEEELFDERKTLVFLEYTGLANRQKVKRSWVDTYSFPEQEFDLDEEDTVIVHGTEIKMTIHAIDRENQLVMIKKPQEHVDVHPSSIFVYNDFPVTKKVERLVQLAEQVNEHGITPPKLQCAVDLILGNKPRVVKPAELEPKTREGLVEWSLNLDSSVLPIQGPPGTGKTYTGKNLILDLIESGKRVGITALSHKVITKMLWDIHNEAQKSGIKVSMVQKPGQDDDEQVPWQRTGDMDVISGNIFGTQIIAGTSSMWADNRLSDTVDYLIVDEAGQLSLADTLVCCFATKNLVLLGDPQQLKQPLQGIHPDGIDVSALEHILGTSQTLAADQGLFLGTTHRMHPAICQFNSALYYDSKLNAADNLIHQKVSGNTKFTEAGLYYLPVVHHGNTTSSTEEAEAIADMFRELTKGDVFWTDKHNRSHVVTPEHIRIITPYNSQRREIGKLLPDFREIGTVDKFQGQEAPITIYSTVASTAQDIPRGMDFLYNANRLNVAVSRAMGIVIMVGSPELFAPECKTPEQMKLANGFAYFLENSKPGNSLPQTEQTSAKKTIKKTKIPNT